MRELAQGIEFAREKLVDIGLANLRMAHDNSVGREIAESLAFAINERCDAANEVKERHHVDEAKQIANDDLAELDFQAVRIDYTETQQSFADGLPAPAPLEGDAVANGQHEHQQHREGAREIDADERQCAKDAA